jgi:hypothetical protein
MKSGVYYIRWRKEIQPKPPEWWEKPGQLCNMGKNIGCGAVQPLQLEKKTGIIRTTSVLPQYRGRAEPEPRPHPPKQRAPERAAALCLLIYYL